MSVPTNLLVFLWGLAGGFSHCIGMCGIFVVSYSGLPGQPNQNRFGGAARHALFHAGRLLSLASLGLIAGALGDISHRWASVQGIISLAAGVLLLLLALGFAGILPKFRIPEPNIMEAGGGAPRRAFLKVLQSRAWIKPLLIGLFVGLLPCGLTYQSLIPALLTKSPLHGAFIMTLFCLGTIPGLLALGVFGNALFGGLLMKPRFRAAMTQVSALIMGIMALAFIWRGLTVL